LESVDGSEEILESGTRDGRDAPGPGHLSAPRSQRGGGILSGDLLQRRSPHPPAALPDVSSRGRDRAYAADEFCSNSGIRREDEADDERENDATMVRRPGLRTFL